MECRLASALVDDQRSHHAGQLADEGVGGGVVNGNGDENAEVRCGRGQIVGVIVRQLRADVERLDPFLAAKRRPSHEANLGHGRAAVRVLDRLRLTQVLLVGLQSYEMKASYLVSDISGAPSRPGLQSALCQS